MVASLEHMLKFTKALCFVLAVAAAVVAGVFIVKLFWQLGQTAPRLRIWISLTSAALTGLFLGLALALPRRSARSIRNEMTRNRVAPERDRGTLEARDARGSDRVDAERADEFDGGRVDAERAGEYDRGRVERGPVDRTTDVHDIRED